MIGLSVSQLSKSFGGLQAVQAVSFEVKPGELVALIGPNGAGKSTTFNMINGQLPPDDGEVLLDGESLLGLTPQKIWRRGVARTFQTAAIFGSMSVLENVQMVLMSRGRRFSALLQRAYRYRREEALALLDQLDLKALAHHGCQTLAYADIKRVELALALASEPSWLLMDEPTAGMAPGERQALMALTRSLAKQRELGVLFTEHSMDVVFGYADRVLVMAQGRLIAAGTPTEIQANEAVQAVYFGQQPVIGVAP